MATIHTDGGFQVQKGYKLSRSQVVSAVVQLDLLATQVGRSSFLAAKVGR